MRAAVLVTGAAGFCGRHLVAALRRDPNVELTAATRASGDLTDGDAVRALLAASRPRQIYHLAGTVGSDGDQPRADVHGTEHLLAAATALGLDCRILLVGSAAEYGHVRAQDNPIGERQPLRPATDYGRAKLRQTEIMHAWSGPAGVEMVMARPFNLLGAGQSPRLVIGRVEAWIAARLEGDPARLVLGDLDSRRDYLPVEDAVAAYQRVMRHGSAGQVYNVGAGRPQRTRDVVHALLRAHDLDPALIDERPGGHGVGSDVADVWADVTRLRALGTLGAGAHGEGDQDERRTG